VGADGLASPAMPGDVVAKLPIKVVVRHAQDRLLSSVGILKDVGHVLAAEVHVRGLEVVTGDTHIVGLPHEVRLAREHVTRGKRLIAEALAAGAAAADKAEAAGEY
jgi:hypothetical protein